MDHWLDEVRAYDERHEARKRERAARHTAATESTETWISGTVTPAMERFADDLRTTGRKVSIKCSATVCSVEATDLHGRGSGAEFRAQVGTLGLHSKEVQASFPELPQALAGLERDEVDEDAVYALLQRSYVARLNSRNIG